jgi:hypothetical protein
MVQVGTLAVSEYFPFMLVLDWSVIGVLLLGDEGERINSCVTDSCFVFVIVFMLRSAALDCRQNTHETYGVFQVDVTSDRASYETVPLL